MVQRAQFDELVAATGGLAESPLDGRVAIASQRPGRYNFTVPRTVLLILTAAVPGSCATPAPPTNPRLLIAGFDFDRSIPLDLRSMERTFDEVETVRADLAERRLEFSGDGDVRVTLILSVWQKAAADPFEGRPLRAPAADARSLKIGDRAALPGRADLPAPEAIDEVAFARMNVAVRLARSGPGPNLVRIAEDLDRALQEEPVAENLVSSVWRPVIERFALGGTAETVQAHALRALQVRVRDKETPSDGLVLRFPASTNHVVVSVGGRYAILASEPGRDTVRMFAVNRRLLTAWAELSIRITE